MKCKKGVDPYLHFQLQWQQYCSAFLLSRSYPPSAINLEESAEQPIAGIRKKWLDFYYCNGVLVPESNPVIIMISSAVYKLLLEHVKSFQNSLKVIHSVQAHQLNPCRMSLMVKMCISNLVVQEFNL